MHAVGAQRIDRHGGNHGRVDTTRQAQYHAGETVLQHIVAKPQHAGLPRLGLVLGHGQDLARHAGPAVLDAQPFCECDLLFEHRHLPGQRPVGIEHEGGPVEDELVLPAHLVEVGHGQARLGDTRHDEVEAHVILVALEGRAIGREQDFRSRLGQRLAGLFRPDVLADGNAKPHAPEGDGAGCRTSIEHALLVEHAIVGQVELVAHRLDLAVGKQGDGVIEIGPLAPRQADQHGGAGHGLLRQLLDGGTAGLHEGGAQHQVLRRIAADEEFRKQDQVGIRRLAPRFAGTVQIGTDRAQSRVELRQRDDESVGHGQGS